MLVAITSLVGIMMPFAGWGSGNLLVMHGARNHADLSLHWGNTIIYTALTGLLLTLCTLITGHFVLPDLSGRLILTFSIAEYFFVRLVVTGAQVFQSLERVRTAAQLGALPYFLRVAALIGLIVANVSFSLTVWSLVYLIATIVSAVVTVGIVTVMLGPPVFSINTMRETLRPGTFFAISHASASIYADSDKVILARYGSLEAAATYAVGYRAVQMASLPVRSLLYASYSRFFQHGQAGLTGTFSFARRLLPVGVIWSLAAGLALFTLAPLIPRLVGSDFQASIAAIRWLSPLPLIHTLYYLCADILTGAGYQSGRSVIQICTAALNVGLNLLLVPKYGWLGAAWATLIAETVMVIGVWIVLSKLRRRNTEVSNE